MSWCPDLRVSGLGVPSRTGVLAVSLPQPGTHPSLPVGGQHLGRVRGQQLRGSPVTALAEDYITTLNPQWAPSQGTC